MNHGVIVIPTETGVVMTATDGTPATITIVTGATMHEMIVIASVIVTGKHPRYTRETGFLGMRVTGCMRVCSGGGGDEFRRRDDDYRRRDEGYRPREDEYRRRSRR